MLQCRNQASSGIFKNVFHIATISVWWFACGVLALITVLDGINAMLFHVEHCGNKDWQWRLQGSDRVHQQDGEVCLFPLSFDSLPVVEWRFCGDGDDSWQLAIPHEFVMGRCELEFLVVRGFEIPDEKEQRIDFMGSVRSYSSAWYVLPHKRVFVAGERWVFPSESISMGVGHVLREPGDFFVKSEEVEVRNTTASDSIREVSVSRVGVLPSLPYFMVSAGDAQVQVAKGGENG